MPPTELESLVSACSGVVSSDSKVATLTAAAGHHPPDEVDADLPQSFWLSKDAEFDWFDRNAFYERRNSGKGSSHHPHPSSTSHSQRFGNGNMKSKASIIGLPMSQKMAYEERRHGRSSRLPNSGNLFPKQGNGKPVESSTSMDPTSPKVSCIGRVRSRRDRSRRLRNRQRSKRSSDQERPTRKTGILESVRAVFRGKKTGKARAGDKTTEERSDVKTGDIRDRLPVNEREVPSRRSWDAVGTGSVAMKRYSSGRRSAELLGVAELRREERD